MKLRDAPTRTDDGGIYPDLSTEANRTHIQAAPIFLASDVLNKSEVPLMGTRWRWVLKISLEKMRLELLGR